MSVLFHFGSVAPAKISWNYSPPPCYQSRSDSSALFYLLYLLWSECEAPHIQPDERLQISVSSISRAEQTLAQREWGGERVASFAKWMHSCIYPDMVYDYQPHQYTPSIPLKTDEWIMKLKQQQIKTDWRISFGQIIKTFQKEESLSTD